MSNPYLLCIIHLICVQGVSTTFRRCVQHPSFSVSNTYLLCPTHRVCVQRPSFSVSNTCLLCPTHLTASNTPRQNDIRTELLDDSLPSTPCLGVSFRTPYRFRANSAQHDSPGHILALALVIFSANVFATILLVPFPLARGCFPTPLRRCAQHASFSVSNTCLLCPTRLICFQHVLSVSNTFYLTRLVKMTL